MKSIKRLVALLMAALVALSFSACGKPKDTMSDISELFDENGNFIVPDEMLKIVGWYTQGTDFGSSSTSLKVEDIPKEWLEAKTHVTYENIYGNDGGSWDAKLTRLVVGKNMPDVVFCGAFQGPAHFKKLDEMGQLHKLTPEFIQKIAPHLWARTPKDCWDAFTDSDGYIIGIPYGIHESYDEPFLNYSEDEKNYIRETQLKYETDVTYLSTQCLYVRDDILKDFFPDAMTYDEIEALAIEKNAPLGDLLLDIPIYTQEELVDFLYAIQAKGYKEGNKTVYPIGYNGGDNWMALTWFGADLSGYKNHCYSGTINWTTKRYELFLLSDLVKETARLENKMLNDEVIESESLAQPTNLYKEKVMNGQYAIASVLSFNQVNAVNKELAEAGKTFRYRPFITQIPNHKDYPAFTERTMWKSSLALTNELTDAEICQYLNWIDVQYTDEWEELSCWGPKERAAEIYHTETTADGRTIRKYNDERFNQYFLEKNPDALKTGETLGFDCTAGSAFPVYPLSIHRWEPAIYDRAYVYTLTSDGALRFPPDSEHVKNVIAYPPTQIWSSIYADIPEVVEFWATREQWESKIRIALGAKPGEFDDRWNELEATINSIIDVKAFEDACTEAFQPYLEALGE